MFVKKISNASKIFEYLKNNIHHNGFVFLQETHSLTQDEKQWKDYFKDPLFFLHDSRNSCGEAIGFWGLKSFHIIDKKSDENCRISIIDAKVNDEKFLPVNFYNSHTESQQIKTLDTLKKLPEDIDNIPDKKIILGGDLNLVFDCNVKVCGGNPVLKKKSLSKFIEIKESLNLCDIWRIRNPKFKRYTFCQNHSFGFIQRKLDYFFVPNLLQQRLKKNWYFSFFCQRSFTSSFFIKSDEWIFSRKRLMEIK